MDYGVGAAYTRGARNSWRAVYDLFLQENAVSVGMLLFFSTYALHMMYLLPFMGDGKSIMKQLMIRGIGGKSS